MDAKNSEPPPPPPTGNTHHSGTSDETKTIVTILLLIFFTPAGIILMWVWTKWKTWVKIVVTVVPILFFLLMMALLGTIFFAAFTHPAFKKEFEAEFNKEYEMQMRELTPSPDASNDSITNWETFENTKHGYKFQYPASWEINRGPGELDDETLSTTREITIYDPNSTLPGPGTSFSIDTNELHATGLSKQCTTLEDCITKTLSQIPENAIRTSETVLDSPAVRITFDRETELYTQTISHVYVIFGDALFHFEMYSDKKDYAQLENTFNQILESFTLAY